MQEQVIVYGKFLVMLSQNYNDIDEVFVPKHILGKICYCYESNLDAHNILPIDYFIEKEKSDELVERYSLGL